MFYHLPFGIAHFWMILGISKSNVPKRVVEDSFFNDVELIYWLMKTYLKVSSSGDFEYSVGLTPRASS